MTGSERTVLRTVARALRGEGTALGQLESFGTAFNLPYGWRTMKTEYQVSYLIDALIEVGQRG